MEAVRSLAKTEGKCPDGTPDQLNSFFVEKCNFIFIPIV